MSTHIQPGSHPDADQLSAFAESALPPHERETLLAHLAVCADCREVVALSFPPMKAAPVPERSRWFTGLRLIWPAAALAATVVLLVYVRHVPISGHQPGTPNQVAEVHPPTPALANAPSAPAPQASPRLASPKTASGRQSKKQSADHGSVAAMGTAQQQQAMQNANGAPPLGAVLDGRSVQPMAAAAAPGPSPAQPQRIVMGGLGGGYAAGTATQVRGTSTASANGAGLNRTVDALSKTPAPASAQPTLVTATDETAASAGALSSLASDALSDDLIPPRLPSGAAVLSTAARGRQMIAIDAKNAVFLSNDAGVRWIAVPGPWKGRAVHAELISSLMPSRTTAAGAMAGAQVQATQNLLAYSAAAAASEAQVAAAPPVAAAKAAPPPAPATVALPPAPPEPPGSLSGTVTDPAGAVIADATVTLTGAGGQVLSTVKTDRDGRYAVVGLPPGAYNLKAVARGFDTATVHAMPVGGAAQNIQNLTLRVRATSETVTVTSASPAIELESNSVAAFTDRNATATDQAKLFAITTDTGERWTSADGVTWQRR